MDILRVFTAFSGYDSQCMALDRLGIGYELVGWSEIDKYAIKAHNAVYPQYSDRNYGDISKIDWDRVPDFDLFTMSSPCFVEGTLVLTKNGYKPIEDITLSDEVLTHTNTFHKVIKPMRRRYESVVYNLSSPIFNDLTCTEEHPLYVRRMWRKGHESRRTFDEPQWLSPKQMMADLVSGCKPATRRYYIGYAINKESRLPQWDGSIDNRWGHHNEVNHLSPLFTNPSFWYIMGRYVGDGWKRDSEYGKSIIICCGGRNEGRLIEAFSEVGWHFRAVEERTVRKYIICMNELFAFVERYGYYAYGKHIDGETLNLPKDLLKGFIEGVIDSDGCFINGVYKITSVSKELVYGLGQCVAKVYNRPFSIYKTLRPEKTMIGDRLVNQRDSWNINWKIGSDKQDKAFYEDGYIWAPINKIEWANKRCEVYNMEVDSDNSYTANGAIAHNCQDFSSAGLQKGGAEGSGTRSSLLWECRRAILAKKPKYILFENVKALVSQKFLPYFLKWQNELASYGYTNFAKVLNARDFGIPQNRERIFMVSILDENASYHFPEPFPLDKRLKDVLEEEVDERYYLKTNQIEYIYSTSKNGIKRQGAHEVEDVASAVLSSCYKGNNMNCVKEPIACAMRGREVQCLTPKRTEYGKKVRKEYESGELKESRHNMQQLEPRTDGVCNTITSVQKDCLIIEPYNACDDGTARTIKAQYYKNGMANFKRTDGLGDTGVKVIANMYENNVQGGRIYDDKGISPTIGANSGGNLQPKIIEVAKKVEEMVNKSRSVKCGVSISKDNRIVAFQYDKKRSSVSEYKIDNDEGISQTVISAHEPKVYGESTEYRIRKLTERECFRLMDVDDADIDKIQAAGISRSQQYKLAGNSIVVDVLYYIFRKLFVDKGNEERQLTLF